MLILPLFFEPDSDLEGFLVSHIQKSIKDTLNNFFWLNSWIVL